MLLVKVYINENTYKYIRMYVFSLYPKMIFSSCQQGFCVEGYVYHNSNNELQIKYTSKRRKHKQKRFHERK